jgi:protein O-mannosyl-transferase
VSARKQNVVTPRGPAGALAPAAPEASPWRARAPLVAAAVALLVYLPSLGGGFLYDDGELILRNPSITDLRAIGTVLRYEPARPLLNLTWALNYAAGGLVAWPYHLVNVLVHAGNAALLASLFLWMARRSGRPEPGKSALLGACLFAASPMAAETVAYVASRSSALAALLSLASLRLAVGVLEGGSRARLAAAVGLFLLAALTKEEAAAVPLLLLLLDAFFVAGQKLSEMKRRAWIHGCFLVFLPLGLFARRLATGTWLPAPAIDPWLYLLTQWAAYPLYLLRAVVPLDPAFYRYHLPATWPPDALTAAFSVLTLTLAILVVLRRREWADWSFAALCLAAGLLPSSSVVALREMVVDHRAYLGSFGVAFAMGGLLWKLGGARLGILAVALFAAGSVRYEWVLADPARAWEDAVRRAPRSPDALCALGETYAARGDDRAEGLFLEATKLGPGNARYWANLGVYYSEKGRAGDAATALRAAAERAPRDAAIQDFLGQVLLGLGRLDEAGAAFDAAMAAEPRFALARIDMADLLIRRGETERARALLDEASHLPIGPEDADRIVALQAKLP